MPAAVLVLESGRVFRGQSFGGVNQSFGEAVFNTSLTGYQEILTDPSYAGQIVVMTAPQIGNTGVNEEDAEANKLACAGLVVREASPVVSNWRAEGGLGAYLTTHNIPGIEGVDTRALTRELRDKGAMRGVISTDVDNIDALLAQVRESPSMDGRDLVPSVTCADAYEWDTPSWYAPDLKRPAIAPVEFHVVAYDFGIKLNILRDLRDVGCRVSVLPATTSAQEALALKPDGFFLSNGPGDPAAVTYAIETVRELVAATKPLFGICLGHQILSLALGATTYKLPFGHHGGNHPVMDLATRKVEITSQNHGFAVDLESLAAANVSATCTHKNLYDNTVEGIAVTDRPIFGIQYHPEASPGPHDAAYLFARFVAAMRDAR